jgi:CRISPR/Cas system-associated protein Cas10 (large subunit of type III CRISPR-Cas system)
MKSKKYDLTLKLRYNQNRSGKYCCDICGTKSILVVHHLNGRTGFKPNRVDNLCNLCATCHDNLHSGNIIIEGWLSSTVGKVLVWRYKGDCSITDRVTSAKLYGKNS